MRSPPRDVQAIDLSWCRSELEPIWGGSVEHVRVLPIAGGRVSATARLALEWRGSDGPSTLVVKLASASRRTRAAASQADAYATEERFYVELGRRLPISVPRCHAAGHDPASGAYCLVLDDVGSHCVAIADPHALDHRAAWHAVRTLAELHSYRLGRVAGPLPWLVARRPLISSPDSVTLALALASRFLRLPLLDDSVAAACELLRRRAGSAVVVAPLEQCVVHGDFRTANLVWTAEGVAVLDWQTVAAGPGLADLAYFVGTSVDDEVRRLRLDELLDAYVDGLAEADVAVDRAAVSSAYAHHVFGGLVMAIVAWRVTERSDEADAMFSTLATRAATHALDVVGASRA